MSSFFNRWPNSKLGLRLAFGALVLIGASWVFGGIAEDVATGDPLILFDVQAANWLHARTMPMAVQIMLVVSDLTGPKAIAAYLAMAAVWLLRKRDWYWLMCLLVTVPSGVLLNVLMKYSFHRARPSFAHPLLTLTSYSFPSGHASGSTLFFGVAAAYLVSKVRHRRSKVAIVLSAVALGILVSFSRVYLGVHYISDVLAGMAEGMAWLAFCLTSIYTYRARRTFTHPTKSAVP